MIPTRPWAPQGLELCLNDLCDFTTNASYLPGEKEHKIWN